ncbi:hypothetical protein PFICI_03671 [Pestalotiopsis fici W106-1]|uniref:Tat pathway signal sequence n=1 Tax=Pestalotiopsis fici (strain W106-1 / CGMCC3.15140) TaxID=1229662 RepID=W3XK83_PESFW|nr:uncharacterized protein PFICI_03671 [Pestalotiopsis fici W106-1]ETS85646.1 hypothetical protein PFICI_03671 [Pestalotiopsis fici W106-1]
MAKKLPNRTAMIPHDEEKRYIMQLDVFHQLHCLNAIRKALHPDYYTVSSQPDPNDDGGVLEPHHIDHCVDTIRQSLMCNADISPLTWMWDDERAKILAKGTIVHTCRRFDKIQEWASRYNYGKMMDSTQKAVNDPLDPETWTEGFSG